MTKPYETTQQVLDALANLRIGAVPSEYDLHEMIADALRGAGIDFIHEAVLGPRCRIDFLVGDVGIEVKKTYVGARALREQASRYLKFDALNGLILVTTRGARLPATIGTKPVTVFGLNRLWGVALP